jgi:hypothetical protein
MEEQKQPWKICRVGGREFRIYTVYDAQEHAEHPVYPDFWQNPEHTDTGRPFTSAVYDSCFHYKPRAPGAPVTDDCGGCGWFYREETPYDIIGICMCDVLQNKAYSKKESNTNEDK